MFAYSSFLKSMALLFFFVLYVSTWRIYGFFDCCLSKRSIKKVSPWALDYTINLLMVNIISRLTDNESNWQLHTFFILWFWIFNKYSVHHHLRSKKEHGRWDETVIKVSYCLWRTLFRAKTVVVILRATVNSSNFY